MRRAAEKSAALFFSEHSIHDRGVNRDSHRSGFALVLAVAIGLIASSTSIAAETISAPEKLPVAGLEVMAWLPKPGTHGPWPVLIFSHGFHGCSTQSTFLMRALADDGYAVFAPNHKDAACRNLHAWFNRPDQAFRDPADWSDATYADRAQDIEKLIEALSKDPRFRDAPYDWKHLGLAGHSLGGYTVLGIGGGWPHWKDPRVKAILALSPYAAPFINEETLSGLDAPVMYQGGTRDLGITPYINKGNGAYPQSPAPKYYVEFDGAGHFAWTDLNPKYQSAIIDYSRAFLDKYLKGKPFPSTLATPHPGVTVVEITE
jgi:predicted dienelactone hydrolase